MDSAFLVEPFNTSCVVTLSSVTFHWRGNDKCSTLRRQRKWHSPTRFGNCCRCNGKRKRERERVCVYVYFFFFFFFLFSSPVLFCPASGISTFRRSVVAVASYRPHLSINPSPRDWRNIQTPKYIYIYSLEENLYKPAQASIRPSQRKPKQKQTKKKQTQTKPDEVNKQTPQKKINK